MRGLHYCRDALYGLRVFEQLFRVRDRLRGDDLHSMCDGVHPKLCGVRRGLLPRHGQRLQFLQNSHQHKLQRMFQRHHMHDLCYRVFNTRVQFLRGWFLLIISISIYMQSLHKHQR
jgi:hypothetical protein